jgi:hypothetical protein
MLTQAQRELIAASIDDALSSTEERSLQTILATSPEAVVFLKQLKQDRKRLKLLPTRKIPVDLSRVIVGKINVAPVVSVSQKLDRRTKWLSLALAASLFFVVGAASSWFFLERNINDGGFGSPVASKVNKPTVIAKNTERLAKQVHKSNESIKHLTETPKLELVEPITEVAELLPQPRVKADESAVLTNPIRPIDLEVIDPIKVRLSLILPLRDLAQQYPQQRLKTELETDSQVRIDLFSRDLLRTFERSVDQLKSMNLNVVVDSTLLDRKKKFPAELLVYSDSLTSAEIQKLLTTMGTEDQKLESARKGQGILD